MSLNCKSLLLLLSVATAMSAGTFTVVSGSVQGSVLLDSSFNILGFDVRTPISDQAIVQDTGGDQVLLSDIFASPSFGNLVLLGQDLPAASGTFELSFLENTVAFLSATQLQVQVQGSLLSGTPNAADDSFLGLATFNFLPYSAVGVAGTDATLITSNLVSIDTVPEPSAGVLMLSGFVALLVYRKRTVSAA